MGEGIFVEKKKGEESFNECDTGTIWLTEDQTLEMRSENDNLTTYFDIKEVKQFNKVALKERQGNRNSIAFIKWTRKMGKYRDKSFGVGFRKESLRDQLYDYIQETKKTNDNQDNLGFGLFD